MVNPIHDGLNLVAMEGPAVNERDGVLVLSHEAGAYDELGDFVLGVNPFDITATAAAIASGLSMSKEERHSHAGELRRRTVTNSRALAERGASRRPRSGLLRSTWLTANAHGAAASARWARFRRAVAMGTLVFLAPAGENPAGELQAEGARAARRVRSLRTRGRDRRGSRPPSRDHRSQSRGVCAPPRVPAPRNEV